MKSAATKDNDILIRGGEHNNLNQNNLNTTSHIKPMVGTPRFQSTPLPQRLIPPNSQPSIDIPQDQNDTPVVLNFTQPSVPDFPIFIPVPMNETPMNRYKPAYITTDNPSDKESVNEQMSGHNIITSRNCLTYKSDNYVHFISQNCGPCTNNSRLLSEIGAIVDKEIRSRKTLIGQILVVKYNSNYVLLAVITARHSDPISGQKDDGPPNPGLYYEQQDTVFLRKATWRVIVVHLNLEPYSEEHNLYSNYYELMHECRDNLGEEFCEFFDNKGDGNKQQTIDALKKSIKQAKKPTEGSKSEVQRKKRSAPLTIIGSLSHGLFGTAIEEEIELVQRNLDQLFRDQKTMIRLNN
uniref:Uncharacterized protein n=1 Tax=Trichogramma kaykai TaxID=54128 RepID=A0ABD2W4K8_9HYME